MFPHKTHTRVGFLCFMRTLNIPLTYLYLMQGEMGRIGINMFYSFLLILVWNMTRIPWVGIRVLPFLIFRARRSRIQSIKNNYALKMWWWFRSLIQEIILYETVWHGALCMCKDSDRKTFHSCKNIYYFSWIALVLIWIIPW